jgi:hypothetical protein
MGFFLRDSSKRAPKSWLVLFISKLHDLLFIWGRKVFLIFQHFTSKKAGGLYGLKPQSCQKKKGLIYPGLEIEV